MSQNLDELLKELKADYVNSLPLKVALIKSHWNEKNMALLRDDFHKLKGTGKTYGLPEITILGEKFEKMCLHRPHQLESALPIAIRILQTIYELRKNNTPFQIENDPEFTQIE